MKELSFNKIRSLTGTQLWLLGTAAGLMTIHLTMVNRLGDSSFFVLSTLFWVAVSFRIQQKYDQLNLTSGMLSSILGLLILVVMLLRSVSPPTLNFLGVFPFLVAIGLALLASGLKGLRQYHQELFILFFLGVPRAILGPMLEISALTAKFAATILWYAGQDVSLQRTTVFLPHGAVNVLMACSGVEGVFYLLSLSILALVIYPLTSRIKFVVPAIAIIIAFVTNGFRVVVMALLANAQNQTAMEYWHFGHGSLIFSVISVVLFGFFYLFLLRLEPVDDSNFVQS